MSEQSPITSREAVLSSLLLHAIVFIVILLNPGLLTWRPDRPARVSDPNALIPLEFLTEPQETPSLIGDDGGALAQDPRPPDAERPRNDDPYARGNTPNRFLAPPVTKPPSPEPGSGPAAPPQPPAGEAPEESGRQDSARPPAPDPGSQALLRPQGRGDENPERAGEGEARPGQPGGGRGRRSLKEALGEMSLGHSGGMGDHLRYDNPVGGLTGPTGGLSFDTPDFDWGPYARRIYWIIWTNWTRGWPPAARAGLAGMVTVRFRIQKNGTITGITVMQESGTPAFDTCATLALEASSPLPPLPPDFPKDAEGITARFLYNMEAASR